MHSQHQKNWLQGMSSYSLGILLGFFIYGFFGSWVLDFKLFTCGFRGETGELRVGIRRAGHQQGNIPSSIISIESMRHGVIASAKHAFDNQCMFIVVYKPR